MRANGELLFAHRLALALGCTVTELTQRMSAEEFGRWQAYYQMEPWGAWRDNWHAAQLAALLYNINRGKSSPAKVRDFMYEDPEVTAQSQAATFAAALKMRASRG